MIETGLVTGDAGINLVSTTCRRLIHKLAVCQHRARHGDQVRVTTLQYLLCHFRHINSVRGNDRNTHLFADTRSYSGECSARHHGGNGRNVCFVPHKVRRDDARTGLFELLRQQRDLVPAHATLQHVHRGNTENNNKVIAYRSAHATNHLEREAHAIFVAAAPFVCSLIGFFDQEGRQQIACRSNNFDAVIACLFGQARTVGVIGNLLLNTFGIQLVGR